MDYLILTDLCYCEGLRAPHIAAGVNLAFWPMGYFFRRTGAFFIRRTINDLLYARTLEAYVRRLLKEGYSQEFFFEGGRSRDGKLMEPKQGILAMTLAAFFENQTKDLIYVPVSIAYDKIFEDRSYVREMLGAEKQQENFIQILRSALSLGKKHGRVYLEFGEPISVRKMVGKETDRKTIPRKPFMRDFTSLLATRINEITPVTSASLISTILLSFTREAKSFDDLCQIIKKLVNMLHHKQVRIAKCLGNVEQATTEITKMFGQFHSIECETFKDNSLYRTRESERSILQIYKNMSLHHLLPESIVALIISRNPGCNQKTIEKTAKVFSIILKREFVDLNSGSLSADRITKEGISSLIKTGLLSQDGNQFNLNTPQADVTTVLIRACFSFLECTLASITYLQTNPEVFEKRQVPDPEPLLENWRKQYLQGNLQFAEAGSKLPLTNALQTIYDLQSSDDEAICSLELAKLNKLKEFIIALLEDPTPPANEAPGQLRLVKKEAAKS
jgi:glycerol-3-phosphate O-acyltransferase